MKAHQLACVVDDLEMEISHVIRGDDLLASAPRNAAVIEALGGTPPAYAHVPQVNGADGKPLSKRHGSTSVEAFREQGILPEALMNYLALLGWSKDAETTFLSKQDLIDAFELERVSRNPARFDVEKLEWMNNHYVQSLDDDDLASRCLHFLSVAGLSPDLELLRRAMPLTYATTVVGGLALVGVPPVSGWLSKDAILESAWVAARGDLPHGVTRWVAVVVLVSASGCLLPSTIR